jgi:hypothetical protein
MIKYILEYKDKTFYHNRRLDIETYRKTYSTGYLYYDNKILVEISDFTCKNGAIDKDWNPVYVVNEILTQRNYLELLLHNSNPKYKLYTEEEFNDIFNVIKEINI